MIQGNEWLILVAVIAVIFGSSQIPKLAKNLGRAQKEFKDGISEGKAEATAEAEAAKATASDEASSDA